MLRFLILPLETRQKPDGTNFISIVITESQSSTAPAADLITLVTATDPKANVKTEFTFTTTAHCLIGNDKIYLSTSAPEPLLQINILS